jgi:hypothetical protein
MSSKKQASNKKRPLSSVEHTPKEDLIGQMETMIYEKGGNQWSAREWLAEKNIDLPYDKKCPVCEQEATRVCRAKHRYCVSLQTCSAGHFWWPHSATLVSHDEKDAREEICNKRSFLGETHYLSYVRDNFQALRDKIQKEYEEGLKVLVPLMTKLHEESAVSAKKTHKKAKRL